MLHSARLFTHHRDVGTFRAYVGDVGHRDTERVGVVFSVHWRWKDKRQSMIATSNLKKCFFSVIYKTWITVSLCLNKLFIYSVYTGLDWVFKINWDVRASLIFLVLVILVTWPQSYPTLLKLTLCLHLNLTLALISVTKTKNLAVLVFLFFNVFFINTQFSSWRPDKCQKTYNFKFTLTLKNKCSVNICPLQFPV